MAAQGSRCTKDNETRHALSEQSSRTGERGRIGCLLELVHQCGERASILVFSRAAFAELGERQKLEPGCALYSGLFHRAPDRCKRGIRLAAGVDDRALGEQQCGT